MLHSLADSVAIFSVLIVLIHIFLTLYARLQTPAALVRSLIAGIGLGMISGIGIMLTSLLFHGFMDGKLMIIAAAGIFYGWIAASTAAAISLTFLLILDPAYAIPTHFLMVLIVIIPLSSLFSIHVSKGKRNFLTALIIFSIIMSLVQIAIFTITNGFSNITDQLLLRGLFLIIISAVSMYFIGWLFYAVSENKKREQLLQRSNDELTSLNQQLLAAEEALRLQYQDILASRDAMEKSELKYRTLFETGSEGIWTYDTKNDEVYLSDRLCEIGGYDNADRYHVMFHSSELIHPDQTDKVKTALNLLKEDRIRKFSVDYQALQKDGSYRWVRLKGSSVKDSDGNIIHFVGSLADIHHKKVQEQKLYYDAYFDPLTALPNRKYLEEDLDRSIREFLGDLTVAIVQIDIDNFKLINDTFGHGFGDKVLDKTAGRLKAFASENILVCRSSGDEFIIRLKEMGVDEIHRQVKLIGKFLDKPISIDGQHLHLTCSIGIAIGPNDGETPEILLKNVDAAMYSAKQRGKSQHVYYSYEITLRNHERMNMEQGLRSALQNDELLLHYQPQFRVADRQVIGFEALLRWNSDCLGMVSPARFIPIAEETGAIIKIGYWAFRKACLFSIMINKDSARPLVVSVNISIVQLLQQDFVRKIMDIVRDTGADVSCLAIEITESLVMESLESNLRKIEELKSNGIKIYLDDFGTGYSSLSYLMEIPADSLKVDKSFIAFIETESAHYNITRSIVEMTENLGIAAIAEGVETDGQLEMLKEMNCPFVQGYLLGRPVPEEEAIKFLD